MVIDVSGTSSLDTTDSSTCACPVSRECDNFSSVKCYLLCARFLVGNADVISCAACTKSTSGTYCSTYDNQVCLCAWTSAAGAFTECRTNS